MLGLVALLAALAVLLQAGCLLQERALHLFVLCLQGCLCCMFQLCQLTCTTEQLVLAVNGMLAMNDVKILQATC